MNRVAEGEAESQKFEDFLPFVGGTGMAQHFYYTGQYDRALDAINRKLETRPDAPGLHEWLGLIYEQKGRTGEAIDEFQKAISLSEGIEAWDRSAMLMRFQESWEMRKVLCESSMNLPGTSMLRLFRKLSFMAGLGKKEEALNFLEKAYSERSLSPLSLRWDPRLNGLRGDPRFQDFMRRTGLLQ
jgi:tetratricopeptide (TPR) repeat protein